MENRVDRLAVCESVVHQADVSAGRRRVQLEVGDWRGGTIDGIVEDMVGTSGVLV